MSNNLDKLIEAVEQQGKTLPRYVVEEFGRFGACGDFAEGFAWLVCEDCDHHRLVPISCGTRGFCPCCRGRWMAEMAANWVDRVLPVAPVRQWVLTVPWSRRFLLARRPELARGVLGIALRAVFGWYRARARAELGLEDARTGSITVTQRFSSSLALNLHFHSLVVDGVYARDPETGVLSFHHLPAPSTEDIEELVATVAERVERYLARKGLALDEDVDVLDDVDDDAQQVIQAAAVAGRVALGRRAGRKVRRYQMLGGRQFQLPPRCAACDGYTLHGGVVVGAHNPEGLERLCRYVARPPLSKARLDQLPDGTIVVNLRKPWSDGTEALYYSPVEFLEKLSAIIPPPRCHQVHYHGVLAPRSSWRSEVVPQPFKRKTLGCLRSGHSQPHEVKDWRLRWADLLLRTFRAEGFECPRCSKRMKLRAVVVRPPATLRVIRGLSRAAARDPPKALPVSA